MSCSLSYNFSLELELLSIQFYFDRAETQAYNQFTQNFNGMNINGLAHCDFYLSLHWYKYVYDRYGRALVLEKLIAQFSHLIFCICDLGHYDHVFFAAPNLNGNINRYVNEHELPLIIF
jgi:hypothetical protein